MRYKRFVTEQDDAFGMVSVGDDSRSLCGLLNGVPTVWWYFDLEKFYDRVCLHKITRLTLERNFLKGPL